MGIIDDETNRLNADLKKRSDKVRSKRPKRPSSAKRDSVDARKAQPPKSEAELVAGRDSAIRENRLGDYYRKTPGSHPVDEYELRYGGNRAEHGNRPEQRQSDPPPHTHIVLNHSGVPEEMLEGKEAEDLLARSRAYYRAHADDGRDITLFPPPGPHISPPPKAAADASDVTPTAHIGLGDRLSALENWTDPFPYRDRPTEPPNPHKPGSDPDRPVLSTMDEHGVQDIVRNFSQPPTPDRLPDKVEPYEDRRPQMQRLDERERFVPRRAKRPPIIGDSVDVNFTDEAGASHSEKMSKENYNRIQSPADDEVDALNDSIAKRTAKVKAKGNY